MVGSAPTRPPHRAHVSPNRQRPDRKTTVCWATHGSNNPRPDASSERRNMASELGSSSHDILLRSFTCDLFQLSIAQFYNSKFFSETYYPSRSRPKFVQSYFCSKERKYCDAWHTVLRACVWFSSLKVKFLLEQMIWTERVHST